MPSFALNTFVGLRPRLPDSLLPANAATVAENCDFGYGELRNTRAGLAIATLSNAAKSIYTDDGVAFYSWATDVDVVRSPLAKDTFNRIYFTGDGGMKQANRGNMTAAGGTPPTAYLVGVPRPTTAPVLTAGTPGSGSSTQTRAYVYTYVNIYGEEGPPSAPVTVNTVVDGSVSVQARKDDIGSYAPIKEIRIYRTGTTTSIADYFFACSLDVQSAPVGSVTVTDSTSAANLGEVIASTNYYPPDPALTGLMALPNGILCAWKGNEIHFSDAYKPWSWPPAYVKTATHNVVGGIAHGSGALVTTKANPYMIYGVSPDAMTLSKINVDQAGVSKWSIAVVDGVLMYASNDGLVTINGATGSLVSSHAFFTRDVWRYRYAGGFSALRFMVWDGRLVIYDAEDRIIAFMIRFDEADGTMTDLPAFVARCSFISPLSDQAYYCNGTGLFQFNGGADQNANWQSREIVTPAPTNFGFAQAVVSGSWTIRFYADGVLKHTENVTDGQKNFRLPSGFLSDRWKIRVTGSGRFRELRVANTARELKGL